MGATKVTLRKRALPSGKITLYLDFYPPVRNPRTFKLSRREYLGIYLIDNPKSPVERRSNAEKLRIAEGIRSEREISILKEQFGFADRNREKVDFIKFYKGIVDADGQRLMSSYRHFCVFSDNSCTVKDLTKEFCEGFKEYLLSGEATLQKNKTLSNNGAAQVWTNFLIVLHMAAKEKLIDDDLVNSLERIALEPTHVEYLTLEELHLLANTKCDNESVRRAGLFSCLSGLRISDIEQLTWDNVIRATDGGYSLRLKTQKTGTLATIPVSEEAISLLGERKEGPIFGKFRRCSLSKWVKDWVSAAGISKKITFHCFRHTYATILASSGVSIYTVSKLLTHAKVSTTQIYADIVDEDKRKASAIIRLGLNKD